MIKKNKTTSYTSKTPMEMSQSKFVAILIGAIIASAVSTSFALVRVANTDHFTILALGERVDDIEAVLVPRAEFTRFETDLNKRLDRIDTKLDRLSP